MEKVIKVSKRARTEDPDWTESKKQLKEVAKAPAVDPKLTAPVVEENAEDLELDQKVLNISN